jgi:hypothetical protein
MIPAPIGAAVEATLPRRRAGWVSGKNKQPLVECHVELSGIGSGVGSDAVAMDLREIAGGISRLRASIRMIGRQYRIWKEVHSLTTPLGKPLVAPIAAAA